MKHDWIAIAQPSRERTLSSCTLRRFALRGVTSRPVKCILKLKTIKINFMTIFIVMCIIWYCYLLLTWETCSQRYIINIHNKFCWLLGLRRRWEYIGKGQECYHDFETEICNWLSFFNNKLLFLLICGFDRFVDQFNMFIEKEESFIESYLICISQDLNYEVYMGLNPSSKYNQILIKIFISLIFPIIKSFISNNNSEVFKESLLE